MLQCKQDLFYPVWLLDPCSPAGSSHLHLGCVPHKIQEGQMVTSWGHSLFQQATVGLGYLGMNSCKVLSRGRVHQKPVFEKEPRNTFPQIPSK